MCGITGIYRFKTRQPVTEDEIRRMGAVIGHRGPDGDGVFVDGALGLGHKRLSIIDVSERSNQPMRSSCGRYTLAYNGEVYNYLELREPLRQRGMNFRTESDTEVILNGLIAEGEQAVANFNGMFAYAFWDSQQQRLVLTRDRLGIKPLYYYENDDGILFASEVKSILALTGKIFSVDETLIDAYMSMGYVPGENTLFKGIKRLLPGHQLVVENGRVSVSRYWDLVFKREADRGEAHYLAETKKLLEDSVRLQLRSDVPLGVFLSGGVDSSAVVAYMHKLGVKDIKTFSVAWDYGKDFNETQYARMVSEKFGTDHHEYFMSPNDLWSFLPGYIEFMDEPVTEAAAISLYYIAKKTREHVTVVLSGEGADEVFGGYPIYLYLHLAHLYGKMPALLRKLINPLLSRLHPLARKYIGLSEKAISNSYFGVSFYDEAMKQSLYSERFGAVTRQHGVRGLTDAVYARVQGQDDQAAMQYFDIKTWLVDDLLIKADRMSMAASLELRVPFLDHRFMEFSAAIPAHYRFRKGVPKYLLKKALEEFLPKELLYRKKQGFPTPLSILFKEQLQQEVRALLDCDQHHQRGYFRPERVRTLLAEHFSGAKDHHKVLWQLVVLEKWHRVFID